MHCFGFDESTAQHELWELMEDYDADEALCFVEMTAAYGGLTALLWFPSWRAASEAVEAAHSRGSLPLLRGQQVWMLIVGAG